MASEYGKWYEEFKDSFDYLGENDLSEVMDSLISNAQSTISMNRKLMAKTIDVSWVEAIENGLVHVDNVIRRPSKTIIDVEEIVPIALSKKVTVESVKHLAQHTDLIQSVDPKTGKITPSNLLNVYKEESLATYENRFVNTLIDRLYIFIITRYEKLSQVSKDEEVFTLDFDTNVPVGEGGSMQLKLSIDTTKSLETKNEQGLTIWQRVEKLKKTIEGYKGSELCQTLGNSYVRPPIMRTNAIMKNVDLKACLSLWQYILSFDKSGYEINVEDMALKPEKEYVDDLSRLIACNLLLFKTYTDSQEKDVPVVLGKKKGKPIAPKVVKKYGRELLSGDFNIHADEVAGYIAEEGEQAFVKVMSDNTDEIFDEIDKAIEIERNYYAAREAEKQARIAAEEEAERRRKEREARIEEKRRIEEAKREERERIQREKEEEKRRIEEMLERRRLEIEAEEKERARLEAERLARIEEEKRLEEEARKKREQEEREAAKRERIASRKKNMRLELGDAEGINVDNIDLAKDVNDSEEIFANITGEDIENAAEAIEKVKEIRSAQAARENADPEKTSELEVRFENSEDAFAVELSKQTAANDDADSVSKEHIESAAKAMGDEIDTDPMVIAARIKMEQQKREKERKEAERAARLKAERKVFESKPFDEIRKQYSRNPIYLIPRAFMRLLFILFGYIPKFTDNPDYKRILAERAVKRKEMEELLEGREKMEIYYKKYSTDFKYKFRRDIDDIKFKRKKKKAEKNKPRPVYVPPKRTPEEQAAINAQMKKYYKEYHVSHIRRFYRFLKSKTKAEQEKAFKRALGEK